MSRLIKCNTFLSPLNQPLEYGGTAVCMRTSSTKFSFFFFVMYPLLLDSTLT